MDDTLRAALAAAAELEKLGVRWFLGGSLASSIHGIPRATFDANIMADLRPQHVRPFLRALGEAWYADEGAMQDAIRDRSSFNFIHLETAMKVDVFVPKLRRFDGGEFARSKGLKLEGADIEARICCAEDIVIAKLEWYRLGGEDSERQWGDILGVLRLIQASSTSRCYGAAQPNLAWLICWRRHWLIDRLSRELRRTPTRSASPLKPSLWRALQTARLAYRLGGGFHRRLP